MNPVPRAACPIQPSHRPIIARSFTTGPTLHASRSATSTTTLTSRPLEVTFGLAASYGLTTAHQAHEWFIDMLRDNEEFEVETDRVGEPPPSFWSETVRGVMVE